MHVNTGPVSHSPVVFQTSSVVDPAWDQVCMHENSWGLSSNPKPCTPIKCQRNYYSTVPHYYTCSREILTNYQ